MFELSSWVQGELRQVAHDQMETTRVSALTLLLVLAVVVLAVPHVLTAYYGPTVYYIGEHGPGVAEPGKVPDRLAQNFARRWIAARHTYTPETYKTAMAELKTWLHPKARLGFDKQTEQEYREIVKREQSSQAHFAPEHTRVVRRDGPYIHLELVGIRSVFLGGKPREENMRTAMVVMPFYPEQEVLDGPCRGCLVVMREIPTFGDQPR